MEVNKTITMLFLLLVVFDSSCGCLWAARARYAVRNFFFSSSHFLCFVFATHLLTHSDILWSTQHSLFLFVTSKVHYCLKKKKETSPLMVCTCTLVVFFFGVVYYFFSDFYHIVEVCKCFLVWYWYTFWIRRFCFFSKNKHNL
jgi:hypothetical protein